MVVGSCSLGCSVSVFWVLTAQVSVFYLGLFGYFLLFCICYTAFDVELGIITLFWFGDYTFWRVCFRTAFLWFVCLLTG